MYYKPVRRNTQLLLTEQEYRPDFVKKTETVFAQCNGYMGIRASLSQPVQGESRGMFVAGLFNKAYEEEVTELVNCPDVTAIALRCGGVDVNADKVQIHSFERSLDVKSGELNVIMEFELPGRDRYRMRTRRFASYDNKHLLAERFELTPIGNVDKNASVPEYTGGSTCCVTLETGINGQITNSGVSHFTQTEARVYGRRFLHTASFINRQVRLSVMTTCKSSLPDAEKTDFILKRRSVYGQYHYKIPKGQTLVFEKYSYIDTHTDPESWRLDKEKQFLGHVADAGYESAYSRHQKKLENFWRYAAIEIEGASIEEEAVIAFAQYHLLGMAPISCAEYSIGAKGLTGEGYKGHVFWDAEIFNMPFFTDTFPRVARNMLEYRFRGLPGAREKAEDYGYGGAMYPWESAKDGREETPLYAALDIHTGKAAKVWSGVKEHHVTADIIWALWDYYQNSKDEDFMEQCGYQMILEAARFWYSRAVYIEERERYEIRDVIGPDEYTEHVDNNAYTNYMAWFCVKTALRIMEKQEKRDLRYANFCKDMSQWKEFVEKCYLPAPDKNGIIPQDDTFLSKKELDNIEKYKHSTVKQAVLLDYSRQEVVDMQVLKQADVVMLLNLFPDLFDSEVVKRNVLFYEKRTLHDSSLSLCAHAASCARIGEMEMAREFFAQALLIDLDDNPGDSTDGIHAAAMGGIWNCVIQGFAGVSRQEGLTRFRVSLPKEWKKMSFWLNIEGSYVQVKMQKNEVEFCPEKPPAVPLRILVFGKVHEITGPCSICCDSEACAESAMDGFAV